MALNKMFVCLAAMAALATPALAQISSDGGPIYINSERTESLEKEHKVLLIGNVDIQQGDARLRADTVTLTFAGQNTPAQTSGLGGGFGQIQSMLAEGNVFYITQDMKAKGDRGVYDAASDTITMTGHIALMRERDVAEGAVLRVEIGNRRTTLDGGDGRTRMVIDPENKSTGTQ